MGTLGYRFACLSKPQRLQYCMRTRCSNLCIQPSVEIVLLTRSQPYVGPHGTCHFGRVMKCQHHRLHLNMSPSDDSACPIHDSACATIPCTKRKGRYDDSRTRTQGVVNPFPSTFLTRHGDWRSRKMFQRRIAHTWRMAHGGH